jgi:hypothetical protein
MRAIVFNDTSIDDHHGSQIVMSQLAKLARRAGIEIVISCPLGYAWDGDEWLKGQIGTADLCIVNGEGTMHDDAPNAMILGRLARFCAEKGVPCFLINSVWQKNVELNELARHFTSIYVRDPLSQQELAKAGLKSEVVPDLTLSLEAGGEQGPRQGLILNGSVVPKVLAEAWAACCGAADRDVQYLSIRTLPVAATQASSKHFRSIFRRRRWTLMRHLLLSYLRKYPAKLNSKGAGRLRWRYSVLSTGTFLRRIRASEGVITGRFHMVTLCLATRTPFFALPSNTFKIEGLLRDLGMEHRLCGSYGEALSRRGGMGYSKEELSAIDRYLGEARSKADRMFQEIGAAASRSAGKER